MSHLIASHIISSRADRVLGDPFLLKHILSDATILTLARCLRVSNTFFIAPGALLYRNLEIGADILIGPMLEGLQLQSSPGYRYIWPRRRNTMRPLLEQVQCLSLVFTHTVAFPPAAIMHSPAL